MGEQDITTYLIAIFIAIITLEENLFAENTGEYLVNKKSLRIIDIPGHERLRGKFFDSYKNTAKGIVYVVDSLTLQKEVKDVAEFLYVILTDSTVMSASPQILILCNKQDELLSKGSFVIKTLLEKEMNTLRITQSNQLESVDPSKSKKVFLGKEDKDFDFSCVPPYNIEFEECQACSEDTKIDVLKKWLNKIA
ncbi:Signal recognition particle receptor beta [Carabus blaptoides fortunei]